MVAPSFPRWKALFLAACSILRFVQQSLPSFSLLIQLLPMFYVIILPRTVFAYRHPVHSTSYITHHTGFLDSFLNSPDHDLQDCDIDRHLLQSATMAETTPLLPRPKRPLHEHSIFQRLSFTMVFHGPKGLAPHAGLLCAVNDCRSDLWHRSEEQTGTQGKGKVPSL